MKSFLSFFILLLGSSLAQADVRLEFLDQQQRLSSVESQAGNVRVEQAGDSRLFMLYRSEQQTLTVVNKADKTYQEIDQARIDQAAAKIKTAKAKLRANFENMSPEKQAQLQPMIEKMALAEARQQRIEKGSTDTVAKIRCQKHQVYENDKASMEICSADAKALAIATADYQAIVNMLDMLAEISNKMGGGMMQAAISPKTLGGIPIRTRQNNSSKNTQLAKIERSKLSSERFQVPQGYTKNQSP